MGITRTNFLGTKTAIIWPFLSVLILSCSL
uniref:Uncharacterized protein n=1 Tax=Rhizophora mucronata TaxID=61149 RepID=A0A2P2IRU3_RHIMU